VKVQIEDIRIEDFDLSLMVLRLRNETRALQVERSMKVHGQLQPVVARVHEGGIQLIDGYKRLAAAEVLVMDTLQCRLLEIDESQAKVMLLSYNRTNQTMEVWEEAMILKSLLEGGDLDQRRLAKIIGHSPSWVSRRLSLISKVEEAICADIRMGVLSSRHARALMRLPRGNQSAVAHVIKQYGLSSRLSNRLVDNYLEVESEEARHKLLSDPQEVIWYEMDCMHNDPITMLSSYGKELLSGVTQIWKAMQGVLFLLEDQRIGKLEAYDQEAVYEIIGELDKMARKLTEATGPILTQKSTLDEKRANRKHSGYLAP
jgi:ParB family chromosome partitioning protein